MNDNPDPRAPATRTHLTQHHPAVPVGRIGVLLVNLGTPEGTDFRSMRAYLKEFLSDKRVIENGLAKSNTPFGEGKRFGDGTLR